MITKTEKAISLFKQGDYLPAFKIFSKFRGFSKEERRIIQIAHECFSGNTAFYVSLGINTEECVNAAIECLYNRYEKLL